jgi:pyruvate formate lyase activating enzyme
MPVSGFQRVSLVDYPGAVASTIFFSGCDFRCPFCQNPDLVLATTSLIDDQQIFDYLEKNAIKKIDAVCLSGGEPLLDPLVFKWISRLKGMGLKVKVDTNGSRPDLLEKLEVDYVAMDVKTSLDRYEQLTSVSGIEEKVRRSMKFLIHKAKFDYEFRTTLVPDLFGENEIEKLASDIEGAKRWLWQSFRNDLTLDPSYKNKQPLLTAEVEKLLDCARKIVPNARWRGL